MSDAASDEPKDDLTKMIHAKLWLKLTQRFNYFVLNYQH